MMKKLLLILACITLNMAIAQTPKSTAKKHKRHHTAASAKSGKTLPAWAAAHQYNAAEHVYFPDYYTYYDPQRGGYLFWKDSQYVFTPTMPPFMEKVDMSKERVQILKGLSLDLHPEEHYPYYMKLYPAMHDYNDVPVPRN